MTCTHNNWRDNPDGSKTCRDCHNEYMKQYQKGKGNVKYTQRQKEYREANREKLRAFDKERNRSPERKLAMKASKLKHSYGLSLEQYYDKWKAQDNKCAICKKELTEGKQGAHVDHDHKCCVGQKTCGQCLRGILCADCNVGIERFKEDVNVMKAAIQYLEKWTN